MFMQNLSLTCIYLDSVIQHVQYVHVAMSSCNIHTHVDLSNYIYYWGERERAPTWWSQRDFVTIYTSERRLAL